ncbi:MAG: leucyl aminopeptidase [Armatimonadetes bacterium]|nr:leucyl aminopeptidase [Armatimonadota bacterium]
MDFQVIAKPLTSHACDALAVGLFEPPGKLEGPLASLDRAIGRRLTQSLLEEGFTGKRGQTAVIHTGRTAPRRVIAVGLGPEKEQNPETIRTAAAAAMHRAADLRLQHVAFAPLRERDARLRFYTQARVEGIILGAYRFEKYRSEQGRPVARVDLLAADRAQAKAVERGLADGRLFAEATVLARDLVNEPPNVLTPSRLAERAAEVGKQPGLRVTALGAGGLTRLGMNALLGVGRGSTEEARLIVMDYAPPHQRRSVALVGKGLTFDSGGLDIKTADQMASMKSDMAGAAAVLATMSVVPQLVKHLRVVGIMAAVENMPGPGAMKPGDILKAMNGKTIEITNTDAEGRLALADAIAYAAGQRVNEIIDIATLTGGAEIALGPFAAAIMGTDQKIIDALRDAGEEAGERLWPLPLYEEFREAIKSKVADLRNSAGRWGSPEKGGAFLREFTGGKPWVHLDIAPVAFIEREEGSGPYRPVGSATGFGVRTLLTYLRRLDTRR